MRKRTKKKIFWGRIRDRISSVVRKINWQYIAIVAIIIIGVCVLIASYFICNSDAKNIAVGIGTGIVTSALVTMYLELINSRIEKRKVERYKRMLLNPLAEAADKLYVHIALNVNEYRVREQLGNSFLLPMNDTKEVSDFFSKMQEIDFNSIDSKDKEKYDTLVGISLTYFTEIVTQYERLPFESLIIENIITQDEYDQLKHFTLINECKRCINILNSTNLEEQDEYKITIRLIYVMYMFINRLIRIFDFMSTKIERENKWIKSHLDDIYFNEIYLFSDEYIQQCEERAEEEAKYYAEHPELIEEQEESKEDRLHRKINEAIWAGDVETIKECFPKIDKDNKQIQSELTWSIAKDVMKDKELRKLYYQKYGINIKCVEKKENDIVIQALWPIKVKVLFLRLERRWLQLNTSGKARLTSTTGIA